MFGTRHAVGNRWRRHGVGADRHADVSRSCTAVQRPCDGPSALTRLVRNLCEQHCRPTAPWLRLGTATDHWTDVGEIGCGRSTGLDNFSVVILRAPLAPSGRPIAMAPPLTLVLAESAPVSCAQALATVGMLCGGRLTVGSGAVSPAASYSSRGHLALNGSNEWNERYGVRPTISCHFQFAWRNRTDAHQPRLRWARMAEIMAVVASALPPPKWAIPAKPCASASNCR